MKKIFIISYLLLTLLSTIISAQLTPPRVKAVFGGQINAITGYAISQTESRIFVSTKSANSVFYADFTTTGGTTTFGQFQVMPGISSSAGYGGNIKIIAPHKNSGNLFFVAGNELLSSNPASSNVNVVFTGNITALTIKDDYMFFIESDKLYFGTLNNSGVFTNASASPFTLNSSGNDNAIIIDNNTNLLYVFCRGNIPELIKTSDPYNLISNNTTLAHLTLSLLTTTVRWTAFNIAPDGTFYIIGNDGTDKYCAYSTNGGTSWGNYQIQIGAIQISGSSGDNISFSGNSNSYSIFNSSIFNDNNGSSQSWKQFGITNYETHPNDGAVFVDPVNNSVVLMTTDQGVGASLDGGFSIFEIDDGITAVQVNGFCLDANKNKGWMASKSGIRRVDNFAGSPVWTNSMFPLRDGSPYYSVEASGVNTNVAFAGNVRIYKTSDNGNSWSMVFTPENLPFGFPSSGTKVNVIKECPYNTNIVMAGLEIEDNSSWGGVFFSQDGGNYWEQVLITSTLLGEDVDVSDIVFNLENNNIVAYVGIRTTTANPNQGGYSVYRLEWTGNSWRITQDMNANNTSSGNAILASISDLEINNGSQVIFAAGNDIGSTTPAIYYELLNPIGKWTAFPTTGLPISKPINAITFGKNIVYCAIDNVIYYFNYLNLSGAWQTGYAYPIGTEINFLYYDDLLAGTSVGMYEHLGDPNAVSDETGNFPNKFSLQQNFPNPFSKQISNNTTTIQYTIPFKTTYEKNELLKVSLYVYDILGRKVATVVDKEQSAGNYSVKFNANELSEGVYFYRITVGNYNKTKKMVLLK